MAGGVERPRWPRARGAPRGGRGRGRAGRWLGLALACAAGAGALAAPAGARSVGEGGAVLGAIQYVQRSGGTGGGEGLARPPGGGGRGVGAVGAAGAAARAPIVEGLPPSPRDAPPRDDLGALGLSEKSRGGANENWGLTNAEGATEPPAAEERVASGGRGSALSPTNRLPANATPQRGTAPPACCSPGLFVQEEGAPSPPLSALEGRGRPPTAAAAAVSPARWGLPRGEGSGDLLFQAALEWLHERATVTVLPRSIGVVGAVLALALFALGWVRSGGGAAPAPPAGVVDGEACPPPDDLAAPLLLRSPSQLAPEVQDKAELLSQGDESAWRTLLALVAPEKLHLVAAMARELALEVAHPRGESTDRRAMLSASPTECADTRLSRAARLGLQARVRRLRYTP